MNPFPKAMVVKCKHIFCIHNKGGKCKFDELILSEDGLCEKSFDSIKIFEAEKFLEKVKKNIEQK